MRLDVVGFEEVDSDLGFIALGSDFFLKLSGSDTFSNVPIHLL